MVKRLNLTTELKITVSAVVFNLSFIFLFVFSARADATNLAGL